MRFFHQAFVACITINRKYRTKIILVVHVLEVRKTFCMRKLQGIAGQVKLYKSAFRQLKKFFAKPVRLFDGFDTRGTQFCCLMRHNF